MERTAQCHCGALKVITSGEPVQVYLCHCQSCQRRTGSVAHCGSRWLKSQIRIEGDHKIYARKGDSGFSPRWHPTISRLKARYDIVNRFNLVRTRLWWRLTLSYIQSLYAVGITNGSTLKNDSGNTE